MVDELKKAFARHYGDVDDAAVAKITGSVDDPAKLLRRFRNDTLPTVAVTVDLLTTGIDVPKITNLVFIRRVNSRILYEQMLGRATRLCPEVGKEVFRIFDAVDIYTALDPVNTMRPVVRTVSIPLAQLFSEIADEKSHKTPGTEEGRTHADDVRDHAVAGQRAADSRGDRLRTGGGGGVGRGSHDETTCQFLSAIA